MNLNKLLCEYFDDEKKGYVTLQNVLGHMLWIIPPTLLVALYIHGAISTYKMLYIWEIDYVPSFWSLVVPGVIVFILGTLVLILYAMAYLISLILDVRIATCKIRK